MEFKGYLLAIGAGATWGVLGYLSHLVKGTGLGVYEVGFLRLFFAFITMFIYFIVMDREKLVVVKEAKKSIVAIGIISQGITTLALYKCISMTSTTIGVIMVCLGPIFTAIFSRIFFKERFTAFKVFSLMLAFYGCFLVVSGGDIGMFNSSIMGIGIGLISGMAYGMFPILSKKVPSSCNSISVLMYSFLVGSIFITPFVDFSLIIKQFSPKLLLFGTLLGLVPTVISYALYTLSIRYVTPTIASILTLVEIPVAAIFGHFLLGELLGSINVLGIGILILGISLSKMKIKSVAFRRASVQ